MQLPAAEPGIGWTLALVTCMTRALSPLQYIRVVLALLVTIGIASSDAQTRITA